MTGRAHCQRQVAFLWIFHPILLLERLERTACERVYPIGIWRWLPMSVGSAREAQHLKWAYYQLLLHLPECPLLLTLFHTESRLSLGYHCPPNIVHSFCTSPTLILLIVQCSLIFHCTGSVNPSFTLQ